MAKRKSHQRHESSSASSVMRQRMELLKENVILNKNVWGNQDHDLEPGKPSIGECSQIDIDA